jgi:hypothetical protein
MQLDAALGAAEESPGKERQAEAHDRGVQPEELVVETEFMLRSQGLAAPVHQGKQRLKEGGGALVIGVAKGGAGHRLDSQMVEVWAPGLQTGDVLPQTRSGREWHGEQVHQLAPPGKRSGLAAGAVLGSQPVKMMSRNKFKHLMKDCVTMGHGPDSSACLIGYS